MRATGRMVLREAKDEAGEEDMMRESRLWLVIAGSSDGDATAAPMIRNDWHTADEELYQGSNCQAGPG